jgi:outer membrane protein OmpA-like peptidoglycan-associated protein
VLSVRHHDDHACALSWGAKGAAIMNVYTTCCGVAMAVVLTACSAAQPRQTHEPAPLPPTNADGDYTVRFPAPKPAEDRVVRLSLSRDTHVECSLSPHFAYGSAEPLPQDRLALGELARCLNHPEVRSHDIVLTGRADARGPSDYNVQLAYERAARVRALLVLEGVDRERIRIASRGEHGARGPGMVYSHGSDRRVDIALMRSAHAPSTAAAASGSAAERNNSLRDARREAAFAASQQRLNAMRAAADLGFPVR